MDRRIRVLGKMISRWNEVENYNFSITFARSESENDDRQEPSDEPALLMRYPPVSQEG